MVSAMSPSRIALQWDRALPSCKTVCPPPRMRWLALHCDSEGYSEGRSDPHPNRATVAHCTEVFVGIDVSKRSNWTPPETVAYRPASAVRIVGRL